MNVLECTIAVVMIVWALCVFTLRMAIGQIHSAICSGTRNCSGRCTVSRHWDWRRPMAALTFTIERSGAHLRSGDGCLRGRGIHACCWFGRGGFHGIARSVVESCDRHVASVGGVRSMDPAGRMDLGLVRGGSQLGGSQCAYDYTPVGRATCNWANPPGD